MAYKNSPHGLSSAWQSLQDFIRRMGVHPLAVLIAVILLFIFPRIVIIAAIAYVAYRLYQNWGPGPSRRNSILSFRVKRRGRGKGRR